MTLKMRLSFEEEKTPYLLDISSLLYDFELLHDMFLLVYQEDYRKYKFTRYFWYRSGRPIKAEHKIRTARIIKESPLEIEVLLSTITLTSGALLAIIKTLEKIGNIDLVREHLELKNEKLRKEIFYDQIKTELEIENMMIERECLGMYRNLLKRLGENSIRPMELDLELQGDKI
jgi:hypothetical protein